MIAQGNAAAIPLPNKSIHTVVTSPPYWGLRKYAGDQGDEPLGLESTPERHVQRIVEIFREVRRVMRDDAVCWLNYGDSYFGDSPVRTSGDEAFSKTWDKSQTASRGGNRRSAARRAGFRPGSLTFMPHRVAIALAEDGWIIRQDLVWFKRNPMPESVRGWNYIRHQVTIKEYENLSRMREEERQAQVRASDLSEMQTREILDSQETLSEKPEGSSDREDARTTARSQGAETSVRKVGSGAQEQQEVHADGKGEEGWSSENPTLSETQADGGRLPNGGRLDTDFGEPQTPLLLLQEEGEHDDGSRYSSVEGRETLPGERSPGLSELQRNETGQALASGLVDCPGCDSCEDGFLLKRGSWRHTRAHEYIFQLVKKMQYFSNQEAVRESSKQLDLNDPGYRPAKIKGYTSGGDRRYGDNDAGKKFGKDFEFRLDPSGRNPRSVLDVPTAPYKGAHYATFPPNLIAPLIRATCPRWACPVCGQGWAAVVDKSKPPAELYTKNRNSDESISRLHRVDGEKVGHGQKIQDWLDANPAQILGYRPTCSCCKICVAEGLTPSEMEKLHATQRSRSSSPVSKKIQAQEISDRSNLPSERQSTKSKASGELREMQQAIHGKAQDSEVLQPEMFSEMDVGEPKGKQIRAHGERQVSLQKNKRKEDSSPSSDPRTTPGPTATGQRDDPPHQPGPERQPDRKPANRDQERTRTHSHEIEPFPIEETKPGIVLDPFVGSGTTIAVAKQLLRRGIGIDISMEYLDQQAKVRARLGTPSKALDDLPLFK